MASYTKRRSRKRKALSKVLTSSKPHWPLALHKDRDVYMLDQEFNGVGVWDVADSKSAGTYGGSRTDGFLISMNALINALGEGTGTSANSWQGPPSSKNTAAGGLSFGVINSSRSGTHAASGDYCPSGLPAIFSRFQACYVTRGYMTLMVSQDTQGAATPTGSTRIAVCAFPAPTIAGTGNDFLHYSGSAHWTYPAAPTLPVTQSVEISSFSQLTREHNCRTKFLSPFAGSRTFAKIVYPFNMNKYVAPGFWSQPQNYAMYTRSTQELPGPYAPDKVQNPSFAYQPRILIQLLSDGIQAAQTYRFIIRMKWYVHAFDRLPAYMVQ